MNVVVIGAGGHARPLIDAAQQAGFDIACVVDLNYSGADERILGCAIAGGTDLLDGDAVPHAALLAIGDNSQRREWFDKLAASGWVFPNVVHPSATMSPHCNVGVGIFVNAGAIVNAAAKLGDNCIVNTGAIVDHESCLGSHSHVGPGAQIAGRVTIGRESFVGIGATVIQGLTIGNRVTIGGGAAIIRDVPDDATVVGVPGRTLA